MKNKKISIILGLVLLIIGLSVVRIVVSNAFAVDGITLSQMETQIASLEKENMILSEKVYTLASFTHIASAAASNGFAEEKTQISLGQAKNLAYKQ